MKLVTQNSTIVGTHRFIEASLALANDCKSFRNFDDGISMEFVYQVLLLSVQERTFIIKPLQLQLIYFLGIHFYIFQVNNFFRHLFDLASESIGNGLMPKTETQNPQFIILSERLDEHFHKQIDFRNVFINGMSASWQNDSIKLIQFFLGWKDPFQGFEYFPNISLSVKYAKIQSSNMDSGHKYLRFDRCHG